MPRESHDREDLLAEATALVERASFQIDGFLAPVVIGFRRDGSISFYFGAQPVYQFNAAGQLRRAFADDLLYKAEHGQLVSLRREQQIGQTVLIRHELSTAETTQFIRSMHESLASLHHAFEQRGFKVTQQIPPETNIAERISAVA